MIEQPLYLRSVFFLFQVSADDKFSIMVSRKWFYRAIQIFCFCSLTIHDFLKFRSLYNIYLEITSNSRQIKTIRVIGNLNNSRRHIELKLYCTFKTFTTIIYSLPHRQKLNRILTENGIAQLYCIHSTATHYYYGYVEFSGQFLQFWLSN